MMNEEGLTPPVFDAEPTDELAMRAEQEEQRHKKIVQAINHNMQEAEDRMQARHAEYAEIRRFYRGTPKHEDTREGRGTPGKFKAKVANLEMFRCIESVTSGQHAVFYGDDPNWMAYDPDLEDQASAGMYHTTKLIESGHVAMDAPSIHKRLMRSGNLYGRVTAHICWERKYRWKTIKTPEEVDEMGQVIQPAGEQYGKVIDYERPAIKYLPPWRVFLNDGAESVRDAEWVYVKYHLTKEELLEWIEIAKGYGMRTRDLDGIEEGSASSDGSTTQTSVDKMRSEVGVETEPKTGYDVISCWGMHPTEKDPNDPNRRDDRIWWTVLVAGQRVVIDGVNPYHHGRMPFLDWVDNPEDETCEGMGAGQILKASQRLLNDSESMMQQMLKFGLYGVWQREGALTSNLGKSVRVFPGRIFDSITDGIVSRMPMDTTPFKIAQALMMQRIEGMRAASGATTNVQAISQGGTATETRTIAAEAARRLAGMAVSYGNQMYRPFIEMEAELYEQFLPDDAIIVTQVPFQGQMISVPAKKSMLRLSTMKAQIKMAVDLDFRAKKSRDLNQSMQQMAALLGAIKAAVDPTGTNTMATMPVVEVMMPGILEIVKKQLAISGVNPNTLPSDLIRQLTKRMAEEAKVAALLAAQTQPAEPGAEGATGETAAG